MNQANLDGLLGNVVSGFEYMTGRRAEGTVVGWTAEGHNVCLWLDTEAGVLRVLLEKAVIKCRHSR